LVRVRGPFFGSTSRRRVNLKLANTFPRLLKVEPILDVRLKDRRRDAVFEVAQLDEGHAFEQRGDGFDGTLVVQFKSVDEN